jgi:release factor glutamine methyltransferase
MRELMRAIADRMRRKGASVSTTSVVDFAGLKLEVWNGVFRPRPPADEMVALALSLVAKCHHPTAIDVGTGTGAVALAIAARRPEARVIGLDVAETAIRCAEANADRLGLTRVRFVRSDILRELPREIGKVDLVVANLPYVPGLVVAADTWDAPLDAIQGQDLDGLGLLRRLVTQVRERLRPGGYIVMQLTDWQWDGWAHELREMGFDPIAPGVRRPGRAVVGGARWRGVNERIPDPG